MSFPKYFLLLIVAVVPCIVTHIHISARTKPEDSTVGEHRQLRSWWTGYGNQIRTSPDKEGSKQGTTKRENQYPDFVDCVMNREKDSGDKCCEVCKDCAIPVPKCLNPREMAPGKHQQRSSKIYQDLGLDCVTNREKDSGDKCCEVCKDCSEPVPKCQNPREMEPGKRYKRSSKRYQDLGIGCVVNREQGSGAQCCEVCRDCGLPYPECKNPRETKIEFYRRRLEAIKCTIRMDPETDLDDACCTECQGCGGRFSQCLHDGLTKRQTYCFTSSIDSNTLCCNECIGCGGQISHC